MIENRGIIPACQFVEFWTVSERLSECKEKFGGTDQVFVEKA